MGSIPVCVGDRLPDAGLPASLLKTLRIEGTKPSSSGFSGADRDGVMQYRGIEYEISRRSNDRWEWAIKVPDAKEWRGIVQGQREWAELVAARNIDAWLARNTTPNVTPAGQEVRHPQQPDPSDPPDRCSDDPKVLMGFV
jgi:hypothetical protein